MVTLLRSEVEDWVDKDRRVCRFVNDPPRVFRREELPRLVREEVGMVVPVLDLRLREPTFRERRVAEG